MSTDRGQVIAARQPLRAITSLNAKAASPLTPRLAVNATPNNVARTTSPKRLKIRTPHDGDMSTSASDRGTPTLRSARAEPHAPSPYARGRPVASYTTPTARSQSKASSRAGSPLVTTPSSQGPRSARPRSVIGDQTFVPRAKSALGTVDSAPSSSATVSNGTTTHIGDGPMFFHADQAKQTDTRARPAPPAKTSSFLYADGRQEEIALQRPRKSPMSAVSARSDQAIPSPSAMATKAGSAKLASVSTPTTALCAPLLTQSPFSQPTTPSSPPARHRQRPGELHVARLRDKHNVLPSADSSLATPLSPKPALTPSPVLAKSSSVSLLTQDSPSASRKRSATWTEMNRVGQQASVQSPGSRRASAVKLPSSPSSPLRSQVPSSPVLDRTHAGTDMAAEARRERKVLDLEISNSSLLAINRSLEREMKKQKLELKRFRRLSRAGRFSLDLLEDDVKEFDGVRSRHNRIGDLPAIHDSIGRPSSPFEENAADLPSDADSAAESRGDDDSAEDEDGDEQLDGEHLHGSTRQVGRQRAKDEARLRRDLKKHRELLLDTARTNRSLQRCLTWTEDLIKHGQKALENRGRSGTTELPGRVLDSADENVDTAGENISTGEYNDNENAFDQADKDSGVEIPSMAKEGVGT